MGPGDYEGSPTCCWAILDRWELHREGDVENYLAQFGLRPGQAVPEEYRAGLVLALEAVDLEFRTLLDLHRASDRHEKSGKSRTSTEPDYGSATGGGRSWVRHRRRRPAERVGRPRRRHAPRVRATPHPVRPMAQPRVWPAPSAGGPSRRSRCRHLRLPRLQWLLAVAVVFLGGYVMVVYGPAGRASWGPVETSVHGVMKYACENVNVEQEPNQVNFACSPAGQQLLAVIALVMGHDNQNYTDNRTDGRQGLEPISPGQGGTIEWALDLPTYYQPDNAVQSVQVAARAINTILGGTSVTDAKTGKTVAQSGLESNAQNCLRYTGEPLLVAHLMKVVSKNGQTAEQQDPSWPVVCAGSITTASEQAAVARDVFKQWDTGAPAGLVDQVVAFFENWSPSNPAIQQFVKQNNLQGVLAES